MVNIVKIRGSVFAPYASLEPIKDPATGRVFEYAGDAREFTPQAVNTKRSRLEQEVNIDFYKREIFTYADACIVTVKITNSDGSIEYQKEKQVQKTLYVQILYGVKMKFHLK